MSAPLISRPLPENEKSTSKIFSAVRSKIFSAVVGAGGGSGDTRGSAAGHCAGTRCNPRAVQLEFRSQCHRTVVAPRSAPPDGSVLHPSQRTKRAFGAFEIYSLVAGEGWGVGGVLGEPACHHAAGTGYRAGTLSGTSWSPVSILPYRCRPPGALRPTGPCLIPHGERKEHLAISKKKMVVGGVGGGWGGTRGAVIPRHAAGTGYSAGTRCAPRAVPVQSRSTAGFHHSLPARPSLDNPFGVAHPCSDFIQALALSKFELSKPHSPPPTAPVHHSATLRVLPWLARRLHRGGARVRLRGLPPCWA